MLWLEEKYLNAVSFRLDNFRQIRVKPDIVYNFRCPVCGDHYLKSKAKAYVYERQNRLRFHCHYCGTNWAFSYFLKWFDPELYKEFVLERMQEEGTEGHRRSAFPEREKPIQIKVNTEKQFEVRGQRVLLDEIFIRADKSEAAIEYLKTRLIPEERLVDLYYAEHTSDMAKIAPKYVDKFKGQEPRIILPCFDRDGTLVGIHGRALDKDHIRYLSGRVTEDEDRPMIFGFERLDLDKTIYVVEGQFDSMFLPNCVAVTGSDLLKVQHFFPRDRTILIFDNQPRNKNIVKLMRRAIDAQFPVVIWPEDAVEKDINAMVQDGVDPLPIINANVKRGVEAVISLAFWRKV